MGSPHVAEHERRDLRRQPLQRSAAPTSQSTYPCLHNRYHYVGPVGDSTQPREVVTPRPQCPAADLRVWSMDPVSLEHLGSGARRKPNSRQHSSRLPRGDTGLPDGSDRCDGAARIRLVRCGDRRDRAMYELQARSGAACRREMCAGGIRNGRKSPCAALHQTRDFARIGCDQHFWDGPRVLEEQPSLSVAQSRFAQEREACCGSFSGLGDGSVFFYHDDQLGTVRWLVDRSGRLLDRERFHRGHAHGAREDCKARMTVSRFAAS